MEGEFYYKLKSPSVPDEVKSFNIPQPVNPNDNFFQSNPDDKKKVDNERVDGEKEDGGKEDGEKEDDKKGDNEE